MSFNLLPIQEAKIVKYIFLKRYIVAIALLIVLTEILFTASLLIMQFMVSQKYEGEKDTIQRQIQSSGAEEIKTIEGKINGFNDYLTKISTFQKNHVNVANIIETITKKQSRDVTLNSISLQTDTNKISLRGTAKTRESFLRFKNDLEKTPYFTDINSPLTNIINPVDISFNMEFVLKRESLEQPK